MEIINLIAIPFVLFFAWAKGRGLISWALITYFIGFWAIFILLFVKVKPIKFYHIPQPVKDFIIARSFKKHLKEIEYPVDLQGEV